MGHIDRAQNLAAELEFVALGNFVALHRVAVLASAERLHLLGVTAAVEKVSFAMVVVPIRQVELQEKGDLAAARLVLMDLATVLTEHRVNSGFVNATMRDPLPVAWSRHESRCHSGCCYWVKGEAFRCRSPWGDRVANS